MLVFDRKDLLQANFMQREFGLAPHSYPCHYIASSPAFVQAIELGMGYGMVPEQQVGDRLEKGVMTDLAPGRHTDVTLYWHSWRVQSPKMERLSAAVLAAGRHILRPVPRPAP